MGQPLSLLFVPSVVPTCDGHEEARLHRRNVEDHKHRPHGGDVLRVSPLRAGGPAASSWRHTYPAALITTARQSSQIGSSHSAGETHAKHVSLRNRSTVRSIASRAELCIPAELMQSRPWRVQRALLQQFIHPILPEPEYGKKNPIRIMSRLHRWDSQPFERNSNREVSSLQFAVDTTAMKNMKLDSRLADQSPDREPRS